MSESKVKRKDLSLKEKQAILERYDKLPKMTQRSASKQLQISQPLLCRILKNRGDIAISARKNENLLRKRNRTGKDVQVESALKLWFSYVRQKNAPVNGAIMRRKAEELAKKMGKKFDATDGWFNRWKQRENIVYRRTHGEEKSADFAAAEFWIQTEWPKIIAEYSPEDIFNADETALYFRATMPQHTYLFEHENSEGFKSLKERVTVLCCANMQGKKQKLLVIGKSKSPCCSKGVKNLPVDYYSNANAWMTTVIFNKWLVKWDANLKRKIVLLVDNCAAHVDDVSLKNITLIFLPANTTLLIQPCEQGIIRTLKSCYRKEMLTKILGEIGDNQDQINANDIAKQISLLEALHLLAVSWMQVSEITIENCFRKGGFSKTGPEPANKEFEIVGDEIEPPEGMANDDFENWLAIDEQVEVTASMTASEICQIVSEDDFQLNDEEPAEQECSEEDPPTNAQMREALQILRRGVQHRSLEFHKHYEYECFINELLNTNNGQSTSDEFVLGKP